MFKLEPVFAILHTNDITLEKIKTESSEISDADAQNLAKVFAMMDGKKALLLPSGDSDKEYCFIALANRSVDRELSYQMEQDTFVGCYIDQREEFNAVYDIGEYSRDFSFCIEKKCVEVISREAWLEPAEVGQNGGEAPQHE